ncbi:MAG: SOS response-associated peptidase [Anaerolineae bacterium]|nr:SOS response-associated peptidase [Anaerolineae bacterium]
MCGRYTLRLKAEEIAEQMGLPFEGAEDWSPSYNITPSQMVPVMVKDPQRVLRLMQWGLIPHWMKPAADGKSVSGFINARSETAAEKPAFRDAFKQKRCLVLADGFYEWEKTGGSNKQPHFFSLASGGLMTFAGLWSRWTPPDGETIETCTILTCEPNPLVAAVHDRMPVILRGSDRLAWLDRLMPEQLAALLQTFPADEMKAYPVSHAVNSPRINSPMCVEPLASSRLF